MSSILTRASSNYANKSSIQGVPTMVMNNDDHIWVLNRPYDINAYELGAATNRHAPPIAAIARPRVLEFDTERNLLKSLGRLRIHTRTTFFCLRGKPLAQ